METTTAPDAPAEFDVLIVGAGLSGIAAAHHLSARLPDRSFLILEAREAIGGTWDLFRYPGVRSDSDMHTLGYSFRPWTGEKAITEGASIAAYVRDTAQAEGLDAKIRFGRRVVGAAWSSAAARWTLQVRREADGLVQAYDCRFLFFCTGYYAYDRGHLPAWPGLDRFKGPIVEPQHWPDGLDHAGKRVVVIGSGATAVTLVPALAEAAAHVTMLQRSPSYIVSRPARDAIADRLNRRLPARLAHALVRWKNILLQTWFYRVARRRPALVKAKILEMARQALGPDLDLDRHLTPRYAPWDQRLCLIPDGDLFAALRAGRASIVTDEIAGFGETGLTLASGQTLEADIVVAATGLRLKLLDGVQITVDGAPVDLSSTLLYKGMMFSGLPNLALALGYTNASWTLRCELTAVQICRLLAHMRARGLDWCAPRRDPTVEAAPVLNLSSGYIQRAEAIMPRQGAHWPWKAHQNYLLDRASLELSPVADGVMAFGRAGSTPPGDAQ